MIVGIGVDIVDVERIKKSLAKEGFKQMIFSTEEQTYCDTKTHPYEHYAARFAAKEAFLKATGLGLTAGTMLCDIEIVSDGISRPRIQLKGSFLSLEMEQHWETIHVSMSHTAQLGMAQVIIENS